MKTIPKFSIYVYEQGVVFNTNSQKIVNPFYPSNSKRKCFKLKNDDGKFENVSEAKLLKLLFDENSLPKGVVRIPDTENYFIDVDGNVYSNFHGHLVRLSSPVNSSGYKRVWVRFCGYKKCIMKDVHWLMCHTFYEQYYSDKGFCCLHLDNDKLNNRLGNLRLGTYSENNKAAYSDGLNPGNGLKKAK